MVDRIFLDMNDTCRKRNADVCGCNYDDDGNTGRWFDVELVVVVVVVVVVVDDDDDDDDAAVTTVATAAKVGRRG